MAKTKVKTAYFCQSCGSQHPKWQGQCSVCKEWNTVVEEVVQKEVVKVWSKNESKHKVKALKVADISIENEERIQTDNIELDRVLGGGIVPGAIILLGGEPGIGKSTLMLQLALSLRNCKTLYVSGEESDKQIKMRAERLGEGASDCYILTETATQNIFTHIKEVQPDLVVIDSIQTLHTQSIDSSPGSISQIRETAAELLRFAKETATPVILIGHITKDGSIAGPKILEHMVDVVLQFEGDRNHIYRILRAQKNRFGSTAEIGILLILGACRRASEGIDSAKEGGWKWSADYLIGKQLTGTRLGILGMGRIGQKIAKIAKSLGMVIHYHNSSKFSEDKEQGAIYHDSIKSLFSVSDVLSICCPATKETENLINKETVEYFPKGAVITNVARGDIVDDEALIDALNRRKIYAVGLDVYKNEPNLNPGYLKIKSAFILPHLGSATKDTRIAMANLAIDNIDEFFKTGKCKNKVN